MEEQASRECKIDNLRFEIDCLRSEIKIARDRVLLISDKFDKESRKNGASILAMRTFREEYDVAYNMYIGIKERRDLEIAKLEAKIKDLKS